jgi:CRP/FNR family cyclic AMP-dependent transcriptional regulator
MKSKDQKVALVAVEDSEESQDLVAALEDELHLRVITASSSQEARLKGQNEMIHYYILDMNHPNFKTYEFVELLHAKNSMKSVADMPETLIICMDVSNYNKLYREFSHVSYLEKPYKLLEFKRKVQEIIGNKKNVIPDNTREVTKDEFLIKEDEASKEMFWILKGEFEITKKNRDGKRVVVGTATPGELLGELSFLDSELRSATVQALTDGEVLVIPHKKFHDVLERQPKWFRSLMKTLSSRLRNANERISKKVALVREDDDAV